MSGERSPGPWKVCQTGRWFYVYRLSHGSFGWREYLNARGEIAPREIRFKSSANAQTAVDKHAAGSAK